MLHKITLYIILFLFSTAFHPYPSLSSKDVKNKVSEILKAHATYKEIEPELTERILRNFIEELDPLKNYFIEPDIVEFWYPSDETKQKFLIGLKTGDYSRFKRIYNIFLTAIDKRDALEKQASSMQLPQDVNPKEFKENNWTHSKEELLNKLLKIKSLQLKTAKKLNTDQQTNLIKKIEKRRLNRENKFKQNKNTPLILSYVLKAIASSLDSHTNYLTPSEAEQFMMQIQQKLSGIGAVLKDDLNGFTITRIIDKGPAAKTKKLKIGDRIIAVDSKPVIGMDIQEAVQLIRGEKDSNVNLTIARENNKEEKILKITITRGEVILEETRLETSYEPYGDGIIAYLHLYSFYQDKNYSSAQDIKNAIENLKKEHNLKGVILDLRNNTGGLLSQAVEVTSLFITKGIVVSIKDHTGHIKHLRDKEGTQLFDGPMCVLVNKASASASEIVAQALKDYGRAIIVGDKKTFGKGSFQTFTLDTNNSKISPKGEYKVTRGRYYGVSGKSPQLVGVSSDIIVPGIFAEAEFGEEYAKYPLKTDEISANFEDDLSDIPLIYRKKVSLFYRHNLQQILTTYTKHLDVLSTNSANRILKNQNYQNFLKEIKNENFDTIAVELFGQSDLQLVETYNIMKDLIFLLEFQEKLAACY